MKVIFFKMMDCFGNFNVNFYIINSIFFKIILNAIATLTFILNKAN